MINAKIIPVAVAVLRFGNEFLLATRHAYQHQGGKLEFVGGKIEQGESPKTALIREVGEELGLDIMDNVITKLGRICHDYGDKVVRLFVYQVWLTDEQYLDFKDKKIGLDGQAVAFYDEDFVQVNHDNFPVANRQILTWLKLPKVITISYPLSDFNDEKEWIVRHRALAVGRTLLLRTQADSQTNAELLGDLSSHRDDLCFVLSLQDVSNAKNSERVVAIRLTQDELLGLDLDCLNLPDLPIIASCHDAHSIQKANELAKLRPVMAILLSPVLPTATHPDSPALGWGGFERLAELSDVPVIALGGLCVSDVDTAYQHGAVAVAGIRRF
ncbi:MAG: NUDIX domain-containing protein [Moraxella sp.]|nr:NUDIX domain-containing protein [Moraxella sp.]